MIIQSQFKPVSGLANPHLQTILPMILRINKKINTISQTLELEDGDFLDLSWTERPTGHEPVVIIFHGLEGSVNSAYAKGIMAAIKQQGWIAVLMHFRGCSGRVNRLARSYHSGETADARYLLEWLSQQYPETPLAAIGYSLGGNMLLKLQAELKTTSPFKAAVSVCAPLMLDDCATRLNQGLSRLYQGHLLKSLKRNLLLKYQQHDLNKLIKLSRKSIKQFKTFRQFDDGVTAPLHGFNGVDDYYCQSSSRQYLKYIQKPTLIIQAKDDPFMSENIIPDASELSACTQLELSQHGGHVGFIGGSLVSPEFWLEKRITEYLNHTLSL